MPIMVNQIEILDESPYGPLHESNGRQAQAATTVGDAVPCDHCAEEVSDMVVLQYTTNPAKYSKLCPECARRMGLIKSPDQPEGPKTRQPKPTAATTTVKKEEKKVNLSAKLGAKKPETTSSSNGEAAEPELALAPAKKSLAAKPAETPKTLREEVDNVDVAPPSGGGVSKVELHEVVEAALAENNKALSQVIKTNTDAVLKLLKEQYGALTTILNDIGERQNQILALAAEDQAPAPIPPTTKTSTKKTATKEAPPTTPPESDDGPPNIVDFVNSEMVDSGLDLEAVGDALIEAGCFETFKEIPKDKKPFLRGLTNLLLKQGFAVEDGVITGVGQPLPDSD